MMSRQDGGHTHIHDRLKKESGEAWKIVKEFSGSDNTTNNQIKDEGETLSSLEADKFNTFFVSKIEKIRESIVKDKFKEDPLDGVKQKAQQLGIKKNEFALQTVSEKEVIRASKKT
jgi:hypothetical protein